MHAGQDHAVLRGEQLGILQIRRCAGEFGTGGLHRRLLALNVFGAVSALHELQLFAGGVAAGQRITIGRARLIKRLLRNGVLLPQPLNAPQVAGGVRVYGLRPAQGGARLLDVFRAIPRNHLPQFDFLHGKLGGGLIKDLFIRFGIKAREAFPRFHRITLFFKEFGHAPAHAKTDIHLPDVHVAVQRQQIRRLPLPVVQPPDASGGAGKGNENHNDALQHGCLRHEESE